MSILKALKGIHKQLRRYNDAHKEPGTLHHEKHGTTSDKISVGVNTILAVLTFIAIWLSFKANQTSQSALAYAMHKDSIDNISQMKKEYSDSIRQSALDRIAKEERESNRDYIDSTLSISKQNADAVMEGTQIASKNYKIYKTFSDAAIKQAEMTERIARINDTTSQFTFESLVAQNRAYIIVETMENFDMWIDSPVIFKFRVTNIGSTPAYNLQWDMVLFFDSNETWLDSSWINSDNYTDYPHTIGAGRKLDMNTKSIFKVDNKLAAAFEQEKTRLYSAIKIRYFDFYGIEHRTRVFVSRKFSDKEFLQCDVYNDQY